MEKLKEDLEENRQLRPIIDDGAGDVTLWNKVSPVAGSVVVTLSAASQLEE